MGHIRILKLVKGFSPCVFNLCFCFCDRGLTMYGGLAGNRQSPRTVPSGCILTFLRRIVADSLSMGANDLSIEHSKIQGDTS